MTMSFITKRERVFNEYDIFDLPARNEGKLKTYASCTDARAWSHFCSDKTEHLVEIIKRNNDTCRPKYVPTDVIVDTLMVAKNAEIARLKRKIEEFEQMIAAYDQLELTCDQKCEIAKAHAAIKAANKELDELCLDLDLSGFTEGIDSEAFETGKSRGDEPTRYSTADETPKSRGEEWSYEKEPMTKKMETKSNQMGLSCPCDASTSVTDPRIEEMQEVIITKDAKLGAMQNTIAVMENDVCEPYCIYAHIYTALEKIFGILCQNDKYKQYLDLLTAGKDIRCIDIKGKILYKLKVLEKFSLALIAPCSQDFNVSPEDCSCFRAEIVTRVESTYALTSAETRQPCLDNKRAQLVADIMENEEMKEILSKESSLIKDDDQMQDSFEVDDNSIDTDNLKRLKSLQENYEDLMNCYETLKHEKDCLLIKCHKHEDLEKELENLRSQLREYNALWNEKEHYRKRSTDLDTLREQYLLLSDETSNLETQLKVETEINSIKCKSIDDLRCENISLERKLNEIAISFEKEKNSLQCKLKETECKVMCQEQQIKSLSVQIDRFLEQDHDKVHSTEPERGTLELMDEIEALKEQIKNIKEALFSNEEEKQNLQEEFQNKLIIINDLKMEIEDWKGSYEKTLQRNDYLEKYTESFRDEVHRLINENKALASDVQEKSTAIENLINVINNKSQEINNLLVEVDQKSSENKDLLKQIQVLRDKYNSSVTSLEGEKKLAMESLRLSRQESQELLGKIKSYDEVLEQHNDISKALESQSTDYNELKKMYSTKIEENKKLQMDLITHENSNAILQQKIKKLEEDNSYAVNNINNLENEKNQYKMSLDLTTKESDILNGKLNDFQVANEKLLENYSKLETELRDKTRELKVSKSSIEFTKKESYDLMDKLHQSEGLKQDFIQLNDAYEKLIIEKHSLQQDLAGKNQNIEMLLGTLNDLKMQNECLLQNAQQTTTLENQLKDLKIAYDRIIAERNNLKDDFDNKTEEINNLCNTLENKIEENRQLQNQIKSLELHQLAATKDIKVLQHENLSAQTTLDAVRKESAELFNKVKHYEELENEFDELKKTNDQVKLEKGKLRNELDKQLSELNRMSRENHELHSQSQTLLSHIEDLETALIRLRTEQMVTSETESCPNKPLANIMNEIEEMKKEKNLMQIKIRHLLDKLDESENIISNLSEEVLARDDKIAILENHINELEEEIKKLHNCLAEVVDTGEQIKDHSYQQIDQSIKRMEAHHSKAAHNIKKEVANLQSENTKLQEQLSITKLIKEDMCRDKHKHWTEINNLQNEREIIITDIKQLELKSVGDSILSPDKCEIEDILNSLHRIRKSIDARSSKSNSLEQTLLKVQTSSQLLLSKADEAKIIVEKEKQKIVNEKEEAIRDRLHMEKQLVDLKETLDNQNYRYKDIIRDLEAEILNKDLIINRINESTQSYISKLEEDMQSLQGLYKNCLGKAAELQEKLYNISEEKSKDLEIIEKANIDLVKKANEISLLQKQISELKTKPIHSLGIQTMITQNIHSESQTDQAREMLYDGYENSSLNDKDTNMLQIKYDENKHLYDKINHELPKNQPLSANEVQVLTANVLPTFDYIKNNYLNYKLQQLSPGRLEQYSISCYSDKVENEFSPMLSGLSDEFFSQSPDRISSKTGNNYTDSLSLKPNLMDIYNKNSIHSIFSKIIGNEVTELIKAHKPEPETSTKSSGFTGFRLITNETFENERNLNKNKINDSNLFIASTSEKSADKGLFIIYRDSESSYAPTVNKDNKSLAINEKSEVLVETLTIKHNFINDGEIYNNGQYEDYKQNRRKQKSNLHMEQNGGIYLEDVENEDDSVKHRLSINLPRVESQSFSLEITSDGDKNSLHSKNSVLYSLSQQISTSNVKINNDSNIITNVTPSLPGVWINEKQKDASYDYLNILSEETKSKINQGETLKMPKIKTKSYVKSVPIRKHSSSFRDKKNKNEERTSRHELSRVEAEILLIKNKNNHKTETNSKNNLVTPGNFGLEYILDSVEVNPEIIISGLRKTRSDDTLNQHKMYDKYDFSPSRQSEFKISSPGYKTISRISNSKSRNEIQQKTFIDRGVMTKIDSEEDYENKIQHLTKTLQNIEKDYKQRIEAIKIQYDNNIKNIINEHNQGVQNIQGLHEETLQDITKVHENEVENLRSMSIEAMQKADKLEKEYKTLKAKIHDCSYTCLDEEPIKISSPELKRRRKSRRDTKTLTKTNVEAFNVKPKSRSHGPCTCSLDINISDTIRNIFEQVDVEQRKMAEHTYMKYIANKLLNGNVETLDAQELSFLHLKVCRTWKTKLTKEEALKKRIDSLEHELMHKQRHAQKHIADLDRKVAEERRRLQEVREAVCRSSPTASRAASPSTSPAVANNHQMCNCDTAELNIGLNKRGSAGDLMPPLSHSTRKRTESNRAVLARLDCEESREKKLYNDEPPTRLRKSHDRQTLRFHKK